MAYLKSTVGDEVLAQVAWKKQIMRAKKLFEATKQAPAPSKDYMQLVITEGGVVMRRFPITIRGVTQGAVPSPSETFMTLDEFKTDFDFQQEVERIFGKRAIVQVNHIVGGSRDLLSTLPEDLLMRIVTLVGDADLESVTKLSRMNRHLREMCNSEQVWEHLYHTHQGTPTFDVTSLARDRGWKEVFYMNKLQLQKELSRWRRLHYPVPDQDDCSSPPLGTFLTEN